MKKSKDKNLLNNSGITLIALVITVIVLLILAGVTVATLTGDNGLLTKAGEAKNNSEISKEKEQIKLAINSSLVENTNIVIASSVQHNLQQNIGEDVSVTDIGDDTFIVVMPKNRAYEINENREVTYLGLVDELMDKIDIKVSKENDSTYKNTQIVIATVKNYVEISNEEIQLQYAWVKENEQNSGINYKTIDLTGNEYRRIADVSSQENEEGSYNLYLKLIVKGREICKNYGSYNIKEHDTMAYYSGETSQTSHFLGKLQRDMIKSVNILNSTSGHTAGVGNCWDISYRQNGKILAWYTETKVNEEITYYDLYIGQNGGVTANSNCSYLFSYIGASVENYNVEINNLNNLDTSNVSNMQTMFWFSKVSSLNLESNDVSNVTNMSSMFSNCKELVNLNFSNWNTSNCKNMNCMFSSCEKLEYIDFSKWNVSNVTTFCGSRGWEGFLYHCLKLKKVDFSNWNLSDKVTSICAMFNGCRELTEIKFGDNFNTKNVTTMYDTFNECNKLIKLDLSKINTISVTNMESMFCNCTNLNELILSDTFDVKNVTNMTSMFTGCKSLENLDISKWNVSSVKNMKCMFSSCEKLDNLDLSQWNTSSLEVICGSHGWEGIFYNCKSLTKLDVSRWDVSRVSYTCGAFAGCSNLKELDLRNWNTSNFVSIISMFSNSGIESLYLNNWSIDKLEKIQSMYDVFRGKNSSLTIYVRNDDNDAMYNWVKSLNTNVTVEKVST